MTRALHVYAGSVARARIAERGWDPALFSLLLGAAGGPKWLVLSQLDRVLSSSLLAPARRRAPLHAFGTSIGSWRHACLAQADPRAAIGRMELGYIEQRYDARPPPERVTAVTSALLDTVLGETGPEELVAGARLRVHIGTVRGLRIVAGAGRRQQAAGMLLAALANAVDRGLLQRWYQRVVFTSGGLADVGLRFTDFQSTTAPLRPDNVAPALLASASIPLTLEGVRDPPGAPPGRYWDGGIVDYHHDLRGYAGDGLVLYPHFYGHLIPGWFDKPFRARRPRGALLERVVMLAPSPAFVRSLPGGKIPDRHDFTRLRTDARIERWWTVVQRASALAEEFTDLLARADPLDGVRSFAA
ncbi:MAG: patatin-like phospholipase family protein [Myxococcales bacterium]|nr:patatin-like phospholipase family protein [Myxococcales bacterium]